MNRDAAMIGDNLDEEQLNKAKMFNEAFYRKHQFDEDEMDGLLVPYINLNMCSTIL